MRNYENFDYYLTKLVGEIYEQPEDPGHTALAQKVIDFWMARLTSCTSVLDVGAGQGMCQSMFEKWGIKYEGVALGVDVIEAQKMARNIKKMDFSFLEYENDSWDLVFSRHSVEHSPAPLLTLMEWYRVSRQWLGLVVPAPESYGYVGRNHYYVLHQEQWFNLLVNAGWRVIWSDVEYGNTETPKPLEYWIFAEKDRSHK
jgi:SAM-dependent methyltransferase